MSDTSVVINKAAGWFSLEEIKKVKWEVQKTMSGLIDSGDGNKSAPLYTDEDETDELM